MRNIFLLYLIFISLGCGAQIKSKYPVNIAAGNSTYITIGGQDYKRSGIGFYYTVDSTLTLSGRYDSLVTIYWQYTNAALYTNVLDTMFYYSDSTKQVRNMGALKTWFRTYAY